jgi:anti-sigma regulatory factor (Ser/Thr protein kinase)
MTMPAEPEFVAFARRAVQDVARQLRMDKDTTSDIMLAVGEACNNGVLYGAVRSSNRVLSITCRVSHPMTHKDDLLEIDVRNHGNGFAGSVDWSEHAMPPAELLADHGRGLPLMRSVVDQVDIISENGDTIVRLIKRL